MARDTFGKRPNKLWSTLSKSTKARYKKHGVTPQQYNRGLITPEKKAEVYGKRTSSWLVDVAKQKGLAGQFKTTDFDSLTLDQKKEAATLYLKGHLKLNEPLVRNADGSFKLAEIDTERTLGVTNYPNKHFGLLKKTREQLINEIRFAEFMLDFDPDFEFDWEPVKDAYRQSF